MSTPDWPRRANINCVFGNRDRGMWWDQPCICLVSQLLAEARLLPAVAHAGGVVMLAEAQGAEGGVDLGGVVLRLVAEQLAGVADVQPLEAVVADGMKHRPAQVLHVDALLEHL